MPGAPTHATAVACYIDVCEYDGVTTATARVCCPPLHEGSLDREAAEALAIRIKALSDPARLQLLSAIAAAGEVCACDLTEPIGLKQPTVSHHLRLLVDAGFLTREQRGKWAYFSIVPGLLHDLARAIDPG